MDIVPYLSAVILISTIATIFLAVLSYAAFKIRDKRRPKAKKNSAEPVFFHRYRNREEVEEGGAEGDPEARA